MRTRLTAAALTAAAALTLAGCSGSDSTTPAAAATTPTPAATTSTLSPEVRASIRENAGLPPTPDAATWRAYIRALTAIDPDIVHNKEDKAVSRGINQCSSIKSFPTDRAKLVDLTNKRFTSPTHPDGHGLAKAGRILDVVHEHICPTY